MKPSPLLRLLALTVLLPLCACSAGTPSSSASASSASASSASASSETPVSSASDVLDAETGYLNIDKVVAFLGMSITDDVSACFREDAAGYIVNDGPYLVDADTLVRLTDAKVTGTGSVKWTGFRELDRSAGHPDPFSGVIPVSKLGDPVFCAMNLPSEITTYMSYRVNGANMYPADSQYKKLVTIGAIYKEKNTVLPDDAEITVCLGKIQLLLCDESSGWHIANEMPHPASPNKLFYLPWPLEHTLGTLTLPKDRLVDQGSYIEIHLTGADLNGSRGKDKGADGMVLHFWGTNSFQDGDTVQGMVAAYTAWIKEPEMVGKVAATVGADWRTADGTVRQAVSGRNYKLTTEPRLVFAHNVGPKAYDTVMDTDKVQALLGLK